MYHFKKDDAFLDSFGAKLCEENDKFLIKSYKIWEHKEVVSSNLGTGSHGNFRESFFSTERGFLIGILRFHFGLS